MGVLVWLKENWGWIAGPLGMLAVWFRQEIIAWWLKEASADRAARRAYRANELDLEWKQIADHASVIDRLFEVLEKTHAALAQLNVAVPALGPAISKQIQDGDMSLLAQHHLSHSLLREILTCTRENSEDLAGLYGSLGRERPSRKRRAADSMPPQGEA